MRLEAVSQRFSGPLPPPDILREYDGIVPGAAKNIVQSFIKEGDHRRSLQSRETSMCEEWAREDVQLQKRGQIFGFILGTLGIGGGLVVAAIGAPAAGAIVSSSAVAAIVIAFVRQRQMKSLGPDENEAGDKKDDSKETEKRGG